MKSLILAADFGGTTIKLGVVHGGQIVARARIDAHANYPMSERLETVALTWEALLNKNNLPRQNCAGVALALPFLTDVTQSRVLGEFGKFPGATAIDFSAWSLGRLEMPVVLENDLRMALMGESAAGAARGKSDVVMLALGTGIGCAAMSGGRLFRGANNRAATLLGHSTIALGEGPGRCGNIGCAEDHASTATLADVARKRSDFAASALACKERIDFETLFELAAQGDPCSQALSRDCLEVWAVVVQNAIIAYDPEVVVLGGGVLKSHQIVLPAIENHLREHMPGFPLHTPVVAASLGDDAALLGSDALFKQNNPVLFQ